MQFQRTGMTTSPISTEGPMDQDQSKNWRAICEAAANEVDPAKLMTLISELTRALDARDQKPAED